MKDPFDYAIISTEILSILVCAVLFYGSCRETPRRTKRGNMYGLMLLTNILALLSDVILTALIGVDGVPVLRYISAIFAVLLALVLVGEFAIYLTEYIRERYPLPGTVVKPVVLFNALSLAVTLIACLSGGVFTLENGIYTHGPLYDVYAIINIFSLIISIVLVVLYRKKLGTHDSVAAYLYIAIPAVSALIGIVVDGWSFAYTSSTISLLVLYVMIQSEQTTKLEREKQLSVYYAMHDDLTDLYSRRAYIDKVEALAETDSQTGVIFCDVNGLKYTNDHYGHKAGDDLLIRFAEMLGSLFRKEEVFRISGDEFMVLMPDIKAEVFDQRVRKLEAKLAEDEHPIACIGAEHGDSRNIKTLVQTAEARMYERKTEFHKAHPKLKR